MKKLPTGKILRKRADSLGVWIYSTEVIGTAEHGVVPLVMDDYELQRRVIEAERHIREHNLWIIAVTSAIVSIISALAAWAAVLK
jgi:hypothetical protein